MFDLLISFGGIPRGSPLIHLLPALSKKSYSILEKLRTNNRLFYETTCPILSFSFVEFCFIYMGAPTPRPKECTFIPDMVACGLKKNLL